MMKFKRYLSVFIILILTSSLLVACGNSDNQKNGPSNKQSEEINRQTEEQTTPPVKDEKHRGEYQGQIDNNSIEIKVTEGEEESQIRAFQLSEEIKENFADYNLKPGEQITFDYEIPELGNPIITEIEKTE